MARRRSPGRRTFDQNASRWHCSAPDGGPATPEPITEMNRREFLRQAGILALSSYGCAPVVTRRNGVYLNDVHSQLNRTRVSEVARPGSLGELRDLVRRARARGEVISVAGGRHAMGTQQFATDSINVDMRGLDRVLSFDRERGLLGVEAGIEWPELVGHYLEVQKGSARPWGIAQKQTGADRFTIGGTLAANAHGRVLTRKPFVADVESFVLMDAQGELRRCSRTENRELFRLVAGGYGMFGIVTSAILRLVPRRKVERMVEAIDARDLIERFEDRIAAGFEWGDFQFSTDDRSEDFLRRGVFSCYRPVDPATPVSESQKRLSDDDWRQLLYLAHADKAEGYRRYAAYYLSTNGQLYWSDSHQMATYLDDYHGPLDQRLKSRERGTEMITEIDVPRARFKDFLAEVREDFRRHRVNLIYGTVRLIEKDDESFLAWAKQPYVCTIFNLHTPHSTAGLRHSADAFRRLIDMAIRRDGSYYLTYHRWADRMQVEACYPQFREFWRLKRQYDPEARFQSDWWRHYAKGFDA